MPSFEENSRENFKRMDIMRPVRSFDPCLPCGVHMYLGLERVLALAAEAQMAGTTFAARLADDPLVGALLLVHDLHPDGVNVRIRRALDRLRPQIAARGCRAMLVGLDEDGRVARVRLEGGGSIDGGAELAAVIETQLLEAAVRASGAPQSPLIQILRQPPPVPAERGR